MGRSQTRPGIEEASVTVNSDIVKNVFVCITSVKKNFRLYFYFVSAA